MPGFYAHTPEFILLACGVETGFLAIQEAYTVGTSSVWSLYQTGSIRHVYMWCSKHGTSHKIGIWACCSDPFRSLLVFDASLSFSFGLSDGQEEWEASGVWDLVVDDATPDANWFNFVMFRQWQIVQGIAWELASGAAQPAAEAHGASAAVQQPTLEDSAPCASGAAQLAVEAHGASRAVQSAPQQPTLECFTFELRWPSGALIQRYEGLPDESIEHLTQRILRAEPRADKEWLQSHHLLWATTDGYQVLRDDQKRLSDLDLPPDAVITMIVLRHLA